MPFPIIGILNEIGTELGNLHHEVRSDTLYQLRKSY